MHTHDILCSCCVLTDIARMKSHNRRFFHKCYSLEQTIKSWRKELLRKTVSGIVLTLLLICMLTFAFDIQPVESEPTTIAVPDDYPTIQEAINHADEGDTISARHISPLASLIEQPKPSHPPSYF